MGLPLTSNVALCGSLDLSGLLYPYLEIYEAGLNIEHLPDPSIPTFSDTIYELIIRIPKLKHIRRCSRFGMHGRDVTRFSLSVERGKKKTVYWQPG